MQNTINLRNKPSKNKEQGRPIIPPKLPVPDREEKKQVEAPKPPAPPKNTGRALLDDISWSGPMHSHEPDMKFVIGSSLVMGAIAVLFLLFQRSVVTTIFFALLGLMLFAQSRKRPEEGRFEVSLAGIKVNNEFHLMKDVKSFWLEYQPNGIKELSLQLKKWYSPYLKIPIGEQNPLHIRTLLVQFIPEEEHEDTVIEIVQRKLGL
ncbi:MAG: hypothetical protein Q8Q06_03125 [bacterium]|nr:hypothetical protein [bacterium]